MASNNPYADLGAEPVEDYSDLGAVAVDEKSAPAPKSDFSDLGAVPVEKPVNFFEGMVNLAKQAKQNVQDAFAKQQADAAAAQQAQAAHDADPHFWTADQFKEKSPKPSTPEEQAIYDETLKSKQDQEDKFRTQYFQKKYGFDPEKQQKEFASLMGPEVKIEAMKPQSFFDKIKSTVEKLYQPDSAKSANIMNLSAYTGLDPTTVGHHYDDITKELGVRDYPNAAELINGAMVLGLPVTIDALGPLAVARGIAGYTAAKEGAERVILPAGKAVWEKMTDQPVKYETGKLQDLFPENMKDVGSVAEFLLYGTAAKGFDDILSTPEAIKAGNRVMGELNGIRGRILRAMGVKQEMGLVPLTYEQAQEAFPDHWKDVVSQKEWNRYKADLTERVTAENKVAEQARQDHEGKPTMVVNPEVAKDLGAEPIQETATAKTSESKPLPVPEFKNTGEAVTYGKSIAGQAEPAQQLKDELVKLQPSIDKAMADGDFQNGMNLATKKQFINEALAHADRPAPPANKNYVSFEPHEQKDMGAIIGDIGDMEARRRLPVEDYTGEMKTIVTGYVPEYLQNNGVTKANDIPLLKKAMAGEPLTDKQEARVRDLLSRYQDYTEKVYGDDARKYYAQKAQEEHDATTDTQRETRAPEGLYHQLSESEKTIVHDHADAILQSASEEAKAEILADVGRRAKLERNGESKPGSVLKPDAAAGEASDFPFGENEPKSAGATLESAVIPGARQFYEQDVEPFLRNVATGTAETAKLLATTLDPTYGVNQKALDQIMSMKGTRDKLAFKLDAQTKKIESMFSNMKQNEQVDFIDRFKTGQKQPTQELQAVADMMEKIDTANWNEAAKYKPTLAWKDNHFRVLWKVIPGSVDEKGGFKGIFKRPLQGSKGFMKQSTLANMSEGLKMGGVPYSYNPMTLFKMAYADMNKFITAQKMFAKMKKMGFAKFIRKGAPIPESFVKLNDAIAKVYYPAEMTFPEKTPGEGERKYEVAHETGEWMVNEGVGRILNNYLSKDLIRATAVGRGLMWIKNNSTAVELSLSPFHAVFESIEAMGSAVGLGLSKIYNRGIVQGDAKAAIEGLGDILTAPVSPYVTSKLGGKAIRLMSREDFLNSDAGKHFVSKYPEVAALLDDLFAGGGKLSIADDYRLNSIKTFKENLANNNYIGATLRALPTLNQIAFHPLFEVYIPRLKIGTFLREYPNNLKVYADELASGKMTRGQLARKTWQSVENRFGEMNFDNLFWNNTFKTSMQLMFRSVTWKLGSLKEYGTAAAGQVQEFYDAARERRAPKLHPSMAWLLGVSVVTVALANVIQQAFAHKKLESTKDALFPQVDNIGSRVSMPTYWRDIFHLEHDPLGYIKSGLSGEIGRIADIWQNKDFYGQEVYGFNDPLATKAWKIATHMVPLPFSVSSYKSFEKSGASENVKMLGFGGFTKAPGYINQTPTQEKIFKLYQERFGSKGSLPQAEFEKQQARSKIKNVVQQAIAAKKNGDMELYRQRTAEANKLMREAIQAHQLTQKGIGAFKKNAQLPPDVRAFKRLPESDQSTLLDQMSAEEVAQYKKYASLNVRRTFNTKKRGETPNGNDG